MAERRPGRPLKASAQKATGRKKATAKKAAAKKAAPRPPVAPEPEPAPESPPVDVEAAWVATSVRAAAEQANAALAVANAMLDATTDKAEAREDHAVRSLRTKGVRDAAAKDDEVAALVDDASERAQARKRAAGEDQHAKRHLLDGLASDVEELVRFLAP